MDELSITFRYQAWLDYNRLDRDNVLVYFSYSSFFDPRSVNAQMMQQKKDNKIIGFTDIDGIQYVVKPSKFEPELFVIEKKEKRGTNIEILSIYYCLNETIYQSPTLYMIARSRLIKCSTHLQKYFDTIKEMEDFNPQDGYIWNFLDEDEEDVPLTKKKRNQYQERKARNFGTIKFVLDRCLYLKSSTLFSLTFKVLLKESAIKAMRFVDTLASYIPSTILTHLLRPDTTIPTFDDKGKLIPTRQVFETVCLFADISGYTMLSENMNRLYGPRGAENLAVELNKYFSLMVKTVASEGGDVFKYAGDAMIVLWPPDSDEDLETKICRATQCAITIQEHLSNANLAEGVVLDVKVGIGVGKISVLHMGGLLRRMEYVAVGEPLTQAFGAEHHADRGHVNLSKAAWKLVSAYFEAAHTYEDGVVRLLITNISGKDKSAKVNSKVVKKARVALNVKGDLEDPKFQEKLFCYVPGAILSCMTSTNAVDEIWATELRQVSVLFVNLGLKEHDLLAAANYDDAMGMCHDVLVEVQKSVYQYEGSINKFLMDDKGSTLIGVFGLPPMSHEDDPLRAVLCSLEIARRLLDKKIVASVGVTTGIAFCGVVGSFMRKEYSVLGDTVNLSARLMQFSCKEGGGVVVDVNTYNFNHESIQYLTLPPISVKGKSGLIPVFRPYPLKYIDKGAVPHDARKNIFEEILNEQLELYYSHNLLRPRGIFWSSLGPDDEILNGKISASLIATNSVSNVSVEKHKMSLAVAANFPLAIDDRNGSIKGISTSKKNHDKNGSEDGSPMAGNSFMNRGSKSSVGSTKDIPISALFAPQFAEVNSDTSLSSKFNEDLFPDFPSAEILEIFIPNKEITYVDITEEEKNHSAVFTSIASIRIELRTCATLGDVLERAISLALKENMIPEGSTSNDFLINIGGTEFFLPQNSTLKTDWLSTFINQAQPLPQAFIGRSTPRLHTWLVRKAERHLFQSRHGSAYQRMVECTIKILDRREGSVVLMEGELGCGKTHMLHQLVSAIIFNHITHNFKQPSYYCAMGHRFHRSKILHPFSRLLLDYLKGKITESSPLETLILDIIEKNAPDLKSFAFLLNPILKLNIKSTISQDGYSKVFLDATIRTLMLILFRSLAEDGPTVLIIDDAMFMDSLSWDFALDISTGGASIMSGNNSYPTKEITAYFETIDKLEKDVILEKEIIKSTGHDKKDNAKKTLPLMLILASRPIEYYLDAVMKTAPKSYQNLRHRRQTYFLKLGKLTKMAIQGLVYRCLPQVKIDPQVIQTVFNVSEGNALIAQEMVCALSTARPPALTFGNVFELIESDTLTLVPEFNVNSIEMPNIFYQVAGSRMDRLSALQQVILKNACLMLGEDKNGEWDFSLLEASYPVEKYKSQLKSECEYLEDKDLIRKSESEETLLNLGGGQALRKKKATKGNFSKVQPIKYIFSNRFIAETAGKRLTIAQKEKLVSSIKESRHLHEKMIRRNVMQSRAKKNDLSIPIIEGYVYVRKHVTNTVVTGLKKYAKDFKMGDWKKRWIKLEENHVLIAKEKNLPQVQLIYLNNANVYLMEGEPNLFKLSCKSWVKKGRTQNDSRIFYFKANTEAEVTNWMYWIQYAIEFDEFKKSPKTVEEDATRGMNQESVNENVLQVGILEGEGFSSLEQPNAYVVVTVGAQQFRTPVAFNSLNPLWNEQVTFNVSNLVLPTGFITFKVWDRDSFGTDDFLGQFSVPLNYLFDSKFEVARKESVSDDLDAVVQYKYLETTSWYRLNPRTLGDEASGKLKIKLCLCLNPKYDYKSMAAAQVSNSFPSSLQDNDSNYNGVQVVDSPVGNKKANDDTNEKRKDESSNLTTSLQDNALLDKIESNLQTLIKKVESGETIKVQDINNVISTLRSKTNNKTPITEEESMKNNKQEPTGGRDDFSALNIDPEQKSWLSTEYTRAIKNDTVMDNYSVTWKGAGGSFDDETVDEIPASKDYQYSYTDLDGNIQGPFSASLMRIWYINGYFQPSILTKVGNHGNWKRIDENFENIELHARLEWVYSNIYATRDETLDFRKWNFNIWKFKKVELVPIITGMFVKFDILEKFSVPIKNFNDFINGVVDAMEKNNPVYHNLMHAVDVLQTVYVFLRTMLGGEYLTHLEIFSLMVSALCHDLEHPGLNNGYQLNSSSDLAILYNDNSILENFHCSATFTLIKKRGDIFAGVEHVQSKLLRSTIIEAILSTDMTYHLDIITNLKLCIEKINIASCRPKSRILEKGIRDGEASGLLTRANRIIIIKTFLHAADISNTCKQWEVSKIWSDAILEEFFLQGDLEKRNGLPVSTNMDRETTNQAALSLNFIDFIIEPLYTLLTEVIPASKICVKQLLFNRAQWVASKKV